MEKQINKFIIYLIAAYFYIVAFGGIIVKLLNGSKFSMIKKVLPEIILLFIIFFIIIQIYRKGLLISKTIFIPVVFFTIMVILKLSNAPSFNQIIYSLRDIWLPFFCTLIICNVRFDNNEKTKLLNVLNVAFIIIVVSGLILGIVEFQKGILWTSNFYTGRFFVGTDADTGIKIDIYKNILRIPSISGNNVIFSIINYIALYIFLLKKEIFDVNKKFIYYLKQVMCIINIIMSTSRSSIIMLILFVLLVMFWKKIKVVVFGTIVISLVVFMLFPTNISNIVNMDTSNSMLLSTDSFNTRTNIVWSELLSGLSQKEFFFGSDLYSIGNGLEGSEIVSQRQVYLQAIDNVYIYILLSYGILGIIAYLVLLKGLCDIVKNHNLQIYRYFCCFTISFLAGGMFLNILQGRVLMLYILILPTMLIKKNISYKHNVLEDKNENTFN